MLESKNTQFTLSAEGQILWQEKMNNPLPGKAVAVLAKGSHPLKPIITMLDNEITAPYGADDEKNQALVNSLKLWLNWHMGEIIGALVNLEVHEGADVKEDAVSRIAAKVYDGMGIVPREDAEDIIGGLTPETRAELRSKKIRLGPILIFIPELNKPAAVRLRGLLWSLYNDRPLPAQVPADGIVSVVMEDKDADPVFYRSIGYPLYGGRAVRIDMLDRVISCIYDHAKEGKFHARHEMAEWLGCSIEGLYKVLESMGHTKVYDPAENEAAAAAEVAKEAIVEKVAEEKVEAVVADAAQEEVLVKEAVVAATPEQKSTEKPELAVFRLKKGKAFQSKRQESGSFKSNKAVTDKKSFSDKKKGDKGQGQNKPKAKPNKNDRDRGQRIISVEAKVCEADNPFAILQQLKK
jgi:ATP-dependent RNA helicase SUPV3L1/SUV3